MSKIFGIPLIFFALVVAIITPIILGQVYIARQINKTYSKVETISYDNVRKTIEENKVTATPSATPTVKVPVKTNIVKPTVTK